MGEMYRMTCFSERGVLEKSMRARNMEIDLNRKTILLLDSTIF